MFQQTIIIGNVGKEPEMRYTPNGKAVTSFSVAVNKQRTTESGEKIKETIWFRVSAWGPTAEAVSQYLHKGGKVLVEGELQADATGGPRTWTDDKGTTRASFEMNAKTVRFLSSNPGTGEAAPETGDDNIPF